MDNYRYKDCLIVKVNQFYFIYESETMKLVNITKTFEMARQIVNTRLIDDVVYFNY